jgi:zinc protease
MHIPIVTFRLPNGLFVTLSEDHTAPIVAVNLWYHVGSANERPGRTGFAHLFEHMLFQGSADVEANEHFELVQRAGGTLNGSPGSNARTTSRHFRRISSSSRSGSSRIGWAGCCQR